MHSTMFCSGTSNYNKSYLFNIDIVIAFRLMYGNGFTYDCIYQCHDQISD